MRLNKKDKELLLYGGLGAGGLILFFTLHGSGSSKPQSSGTSPLQMMANPSQASLDQAIVQARSTALQARDTAIVQLEGLRTQQAIAINTNLTNKQIAFNTNKNQTLQAQIASAMAEAVAKTEANAQIQTAQSQANAITTLGQQQQQGSLWNSIFGFLGNIFPFLGGNQNNSVYTPTGPSAFSFPMSLPPVYQPGIATGPILVGGG